MKALLALTLTLTAATLIASLTTSLAEPAKTPAVGDTAPLIEGKIRPATPGNFPMTSARKSSCAIA
jgi:hypothetical protein